MLRTVGTCITARRSTSQKRAILSRVSIVTGFVAAAEDDVRLDTHAPQLLHGVLRRLRLQLAGRADVGQVGDVDRKRVFGRLFAAHLADRLEEHLALDVADGAADLDDHGLGAGDPADAANALLDLAA